MENFIEYKIFGDVPVDKLVSEAKQYVKEYLWFKQGFNLKRLDDCIYGKSVIGDCQADEWFIVFLLYKISTTFPDLVIQMYDIDGDFLLIEAADVIPDWLTPENSDNKLFLKNGSWYLIEGTECIGISEALIRLNETEVNKEITGVIMEQVSRYPSQSDQNSHVSLCLVPKNLIRIVKKRPDLVGCAVEAFYYRDAISLKHCSSPKHFSPLKHEFRLFPVKFSKMHYAQLRAQSFNIPKVYEKLTAENPVALDIGIKLVCGFEILFSDELFSKRNWVHYKKRLETVGYFEGELEGSKRYKELEEEAKNAFVENNYEESTEHLHDLLVSDEESDEESGSESPEVCDDESWLHVSEPSRHEQRLDSVIKNMEKFLNAESGLEGVIFDSGSEIDEESSEDEFDEDVDYIREMIKTLNSWKPNNESQEGQLGDSFYDLMADLHPNYSDNTSKSESKSESTTPKESIVESIKAEKGLYGPMSALLDTMTMKK